MKYLTLTCLFFALVLSGCDDGSSDLPVSTIQWESGEDGFVQFSTNIT
jgi:hypothetical protein